MAPNKTPQTITRDIIHFILSKQIVHYQDIMNYTNLSRKTVAKYLNKVEEETSSVGVHLVRKRGKGIRFEGDISPILGMLPDFDKIESTDKFRKIDILIFLMKSNEPLLLDDLANKFFISKSTLERDINSLKKEYNFELFSGITGIQYINSERDSRRIMGMILQQYWGQEIHQNKGTNKVIRMFKVPDSLYKYIDEEILKKTQVILKNFMEDLNLEFNDYQYESLLIHITIAIQRIKNGEYISNTFDTLVESTKISQSTEKLVDLLSKNFQYDIPKDEVVYLNLHIVAIEDGYLSLDNMQSDESYLTTWLRQNLNDYDEILLKNLVFHLKPALKRIQNGININSPFTDKVKQNFPISFEEAIDLSIAINKKFHVEFNEDEISYLGLHFQSYIERKNENVPKVKALIICSTGYGTAMLLKQRIMDKVPNIEILDTLSVGELTELNIESDIVISTVPIVMNDTEVIQVGPFLNDQEIDLLKKTTEKVRKEKYSNQGFNELLFSECIIANSESQNSTEAITEIVTKMQNSNLVDDGMISAALDREKIASTAINNIAMPHGDIAHVIRPSIGILTSKKGIQWDKNRVHLLFFIALNTAVEEKLDDIYSYFYELIQDKNIVKELSLADHSKTIMNIIEMKN